MIILVQVQLFLPESIETIHQSHILHDNVELFVFTNSKISLVVKWDMILSYMKFDKLCL